MEQTLEQKIAAARESKRLKALAETGQTTNLPSSATLQTTRPEAIIIDDVQPIKTIITNSVGIAFDPYFIEGVGKLNDKQSLAVLKYGINGESGCLIGPAGTGKTTTMRALVRAIILSGRIPILSEELGHKYLKGGLPGIWGGSFTRIATKNLRNQMPEDIQSNITTLHKALEFEPEIITVYDEVAKKDKKTMIFKPTRNAFRSLPRQLCVFIFDESSMIGVKLHSQMIDAVHPDVKPQLIYIGDIAQLPPVMDDAILGYKLIELQTVELTEVYRHAGAIVALANRVRVGETIPDAKDMYMYSGNLRKMPKKLIDEWFLKNGWITEDTHRWYKEEDGSKVTVAHWKNRLEGEVGQLKALQNLGGANIQEKKYAFFPKEIEEGRYDPMTDMILMPYNKAVGTLELNKYLSQFLGRKREAEIYEVIAGFNKLYLAVGDKIFHDREEAIITKININGMYAGRVPQPSSVTLDRWGHNTAGTPKTSDAAEMQSIDALLANISTGSEDEERKNQSSHVIYVRKLDAEEGEEDEKLTTAAQLNGLIFGYALTIHKSQGSQWKKVYCVFHNSHNRNLQRELLYTAITRAQKELYVIAEPETFIQGVLSQHIVGNTLAEKAEYFKGKIASDKIKNDLFANQNSKG